MHILFEQFMLSHMHRKHVTTGGKHVTWCVKNMLGCWSIWSLLREHVPYACIVVSSKMIITDNFTPNSNADVDVNGDNRVSRFNRKRTHLTLSQCEQFPLHAQPKLKTCKTRTAASYVSFSFITIQMDKSTFVKLKVLQMCFSFWLHGCKMEIHYQSNSLKMWTDFLLRRSLMLWTINPSNHHKKYASSPMLCFTWQENEARLTQLLVDAAGWNAATFLTLLPLSYQGGCLLTAAAVWPGHHSEFLMLTQHLNGQLNVKLWLKRPPISNSQPLVGCQLHQCKFDNSYNDKIIPFLLNTDK